MIIQSRTVTWFSVSIGLLPEPFDNVLVYFPVETPFYCNRQRVVDGMDIGCWAGGDWYINGESMPTLLKITHWAPLPDPPTRPEGDAGSTVAAPRR